MDPNEKAEIAGKLLAMETTLGILLSLVMRDRDEPESRINRLMDAIADEFEETANEDIDTPEDYLEAMVEAHGETVEVIKSVAIGMLPNRNEDGTS
ncbi:hypothetical protein [Pollutimonas harenae]|uniref:Uncharacterized protein n=1 Tax=Pollutimonas harenae TaxID=657015 RepID=A0A853H1A3_9BURK|nr:hypothetical protein [Pollutimonas harenae]NYT85810.1 hypothetical protein [Pollutimonas harenae]TEA70870.1 hypothetical protein ERD84_09435 [Pollutimonas harenae]